MHRAEQIKLVPPIVIRPCPVPRRIETVCRKVSDSARVVIRFTERVLHLSVEKFRRLPTKRQFQSIAFLIAVGLDLSFLSKSRIRTYERPRKRGIGVNRTKQIDSARPDIGRAESAFCRHLTFHANAVLNC